MNPIKGLFQSRRFWTVLINAVISTIILVGGLFYKPEAMDQVVKIIAIYQPVFIILIAAFTVDDAQNIKLEGKKIDLEIAKLYTVQSPVPPYIIADDFPTSVLKE